MRLFHDDLSNRPKHMDAMYKDLGLWTEFMLHDLLPRVIEDVSKGKGHPEGRLEQRHEKIMRIDLCAFDNAREDPEHLNQTEYDLPLYVHLMIEHENNNPNGELWKLLQLYAPLKILVCYLFPRGTQAVYVIDRTLERYKEMYNKACAFHPRSADDAYLLIIGRHRSHAEKPSELHWEGHKIEAGEQDFTHINLT